MMIAKSKGSLLATLGMLLIIASASLAASSESFVEEARQTNIGVTLYGGKAPLKTEGDTKPTGQPVTNKNKKMSQQQDKVSRENTAKTNPTIAQTSLSGAGERDSTWFYSLGITCLLVALISFYYLNKKRKREK